MGIYLNPGDEKFQMAKESKIYIDKTGMLVYLNQMISTELRYICVSRPRRFGKSMAANMVSAYYDRTVDARADFAGLQIVRDKSFAKYCSRYDVLALNMQEFLSRSQDMQALLALLKKSILWELLEEYPEYRYFDDEDLARTMADIYNKTKRPFVIVIDEWDCIFREYKENHEAQRQYLDFLRDWLKDKVYIGLAYMTGILPIKKYGTHSALNMFMEYSMTNPRELAKYAGFTESEVEQLCERYHMDLAETRQWYDGYHFKTIGAIYSPRSVVFAMLGRVYDNYWNQTETFEALQIYIDSNFEGLKDAILILLSGDRKKVDIRSFANDMTTFHNADDVLTLLVHLGYLGYDFERQEVFIPNKEIMSEFVTATTVSKWTEILKSVKCSDGLLQATWRMDEASVANGISEAHFETSHLQYNDENALSYTVSLAYYSAREYYHVVREMPAGKGFADLIFIPRKKYADIPAMVVELKWNQSANTAIQQIKDKCYGDALADYKGSMLLVGISYDKIHREHHCRIEKGEK